VSVLIGYLLLALSGSALNLSSPVASRVFDKTQALSKLTGMRSDEMNEGYTRSRGIPLANNPELAQKIPEDDTMRALYYNLSKLAPHIQKQMAPANDIKKQIDAARQGGYAPQTQREIVNSLMRQYQQKMRGVDEQLSAFEGYLGQMVGKRVEIDKIDFRRGPEQFTIPNVE